MYIDKKNVIVAKISSNAFNLQISLLLAVDQFCFYWTTLSKFEL